uniref:hypothetical protein n=1 Tax=Pseudoxanthomonas sp. z9 TaxID=2584942 RepID=UPI001C65EAB3
EDQARLLSEAVDVFVIEGEATGGMRPHSAAPAAPVMPATPARASVRPAPRKPAAPIRRKPEPALADGDWQEF